MALANIAKLERELGFDVFGSDRAIALNYVQIHKRALTQTLLYGVRP